VLDKTSSEPNGFAFVEMPKPGVAIAAMKTLNGKNLANNKIRVKRLKINGYNAVNQFKYSAS
jgi:RNA recognition motif-containing protein